MEFDLGWGNPYVVSETLDGYYKQSPKLIDIANMQYTDYEGIPELVSILKRTLGYKHVIVTSGTTPAINVVLRVFKRLGAKTVSTGKPFFPFYPDIIKKCDLNHKIGFNGGGLTLVDSPSNPYGKLHTFKTTNDVIWDSVYANPVYMNSPVQIKELLSHRVNVGSFSKWLGLTGLRIGWIATDNAIDFELFMEEMRYETCTVSVVGQALALDILTKTDIDKFHRAANMRINMNRGEFLKLQGFFDGQIIPQDGMFFPAWVGNKAVQIIERANVRFIKLDTMGDSTLIRFNLAQNNKITRDAIKAIKTSDRIKNKV